MEWQMNDELKRFGRKWSWLEVLSQLLPGGTEVNHKEASVTTAGVLAEIRTEHLLNTSQQHYI
jgi:hypothetical protein